MKKIQEEPIYISSYDDLIFKKEECESFINFAKDLFKNFPKCFKLI